MKLTSGLVGAEAKGPIGWLIWDNPSKLNALSPGMYEDALSVIEDYAADPADQGRGHARRRPESFYLRR